MMYLYISVETSDEILTAFVESHFANALNYEDNYLKYVFYDFKDYVFCAIKGIEWLWKTRLDYGVYKITNFTIK